MLILSFKFLIRYNIQSPFLDQNYRNLTNIFVAESTSSRLSPNLNIPFNHPPPRRVSKETLNLFIIAQSDREIVGIPTALIARTRALIIHAISTRGNYEDVRVKYRLSPSSSRSGH